MRKLFKTGILLALLLLLLAGAVPVRALAVTGTPERVTAQIPYKLEGESGTIILVADEAKESEIPLPMPDTTRVPVQTDGSGVFEITYTKPGNYFYKVYQEEGYIKELEYYDKRVYEVAVYITVNENTDELSSTVVVSLAGADQTEKPGTVLFQNPPPTTLAITKVAKRGDQVATEVFAGEVITYEIMVKNTGENKAYKVEVEDRLPTMTPQPTLVEGSISHSGYSDGKTIKWTLEELGAGESETLTFNVQIPSKVSSYTLWTNTVEVTNYSKPANSDTIKATCDIYTGIPQGSIEKLQSYNGGARTKEIIYVQPGGTITYYVTLTNTGTGSLLNPYIADEIPSGLTLVNGSVNPAGTVTNGEIVWSLNTLGPRESVTVSFSVTVPNVTVRTVWTNMASGFYTSGAQSGTQSGISLFRAKAADEIQLDTNTVTAIYDPDRTDSDLPKTGDESDPGLWLTLLSMSFVCLGGAAFVLRRKGKMGRR